jgi:hypothetical protein
MSEFRFIWSEFMFGYKRVFAVLTWLVLCITTASSQQAFIDSGAVSRNVRFNVVVTTVSGQCVTDLQQQNFTIFDNNSTQAITSFGAITVSPNRVKVPHLVYAAGNGANSGCYEHGVLFQYEITFSVPSDARRNEYRSVGIRVDSPNLIVQTRQGYYAQF